MAAAQDVRITELQRELELCRARGRVLETEVEKLKAVIQQRPARPAFSSRPGAPKVTPAVAMATPTSQATSGNCSEQQPTAATPQPFRTILGRDAPPPPADSDTGGQPWTAVARRGAKGGALHKWPRYTPMSAAATPEDAVRALTGFVAGPRNLKTAYFSGIKKQCYKAIRDSFGRNGINLWALTDMSWLGHNTLEVVMEERGAAELVAKIQRIPLAQLLSGFDPAMPPQRTDRSPSPMDIAQARAKYTTRLERRLTIPIARDLAEHYEGIITAIRNEDAAKASTESLLRELGTSPASSGTAPPTPAAPEVRSAPGAAPAEEQTTAAPPVLAPEQPDVEMSAETTLGGTNV